MNMKGAGGKGRKRKDIKERRKEKDRMYRRREGERNMKEKVVE